MLISHKVHSIKCSLFINVHFQTAELQNTSGSEHLTSGPEHHACRASINTIHQGTSTHGSWHDLTSLCRE